jgi:pyruvate dehydrogenase complex dehydrogenase (E1) component
VAQRVFFLNTLKEGADPAEYEEWVRTVDYPVARRQPAISSYVVTRVDGHVVDGAELPCQYLEVIEVTSIEEYRTSLEGNEELEALLREWATFVDRSVAVYGEVIDG